MLYSINDLPGDASKRLIQEKFNLFINRELFIRYVLYKSEFITDEFEKIREHNIKHRQGILNVMDTEDEFISEFFKIFCADVEFAYEIVYNNTQNIYFKIQVLNKNLFIFKDFIYENYNLSEILIKNLLIEYRRNHIYEDLKTLIFNQYDEYLTYYNTLLVFRQKIIDHLKNRINIYSLTFNTKEIEVLFNDYPMYTEDNPFEILSKINTINIHTLDVYNQPYVSADNLFSYGGLEFNLVYESGLKNIKIIWYKNERRIVWVEKENGEESALHLFNIKNVIKNLESNIASMYEN